MPRRPCGSIAAWSMRRSRPRAPTYDLTPRNPAHTVHIGGDTINFTLVAGPPNVHDMERGRRSGNLRDYSDLVRLAQHFNCIHMLGNQVCAPVELPANARHLDTYFANLTLTDKSFHVSAIGRGRALDGIEMMAISRGLTLDQMRDDPGVTTIISVNSPRRFDDMMADGLMTMAEHGQSVAVTPFTLMGAMSPVTLAGALAQQNAEALFGIVLTQLVRPGAPVMYGAFTSPMSTCARARRPSARRKIPRPISRRANWRGATICPIARRRAAPPTRPTRKAPTRR